jgi:proteasome lid subunit RPN8/RPN11
MASMWMVVEGGRGRDKSGQDEAIPAKKALYKWPKENCMAGIIAFIRSIFDWLLISESSRFSRVQLAPGIIEDIQDFAWASHPHEFLASLEGKVKDGTLTITGLLYQPFKATHRSATLDVIDLPMTSGAIGSVHSHPSGSNSPSRDDLMFFRKKGIVHIIVRYPYTAADMACYDSSGQPCEL